MKKVLLFSRDPGGANTIIPLVGPLTKSGYEVFLYGKDVALNRYKMCDLQGRDIIADIGDVTRENIYNFIKNKSPDLVITGTSADDFTEKYLWDVCNQLEIVSFAILDQWINYGVRFSPYSVAQLHAYQNNKVHCYLPTKICVMDNFARQEMMDEGFDGSKIIVTGQPYFELLWEYQAKKQNQLSRLGKNEFQFEHFTIIFISEPISLTYQAQGELACYWGYTERTIFKSLLECLSTLAHVNHKKITIIIKTHPKEPINNFDDFCLHNNDKLIDIFVDKKTHIWDLILRADLICGMSSMALIEAVVLHKQILSIQIGLCKNDPFILSRKGLLKSIVDKQSLFDELKKIYAGGVSKDYNFEIIKNPVKNVLSEVRRVLCKKLTKKVVKMRPCCNMQD